MYFSKVFLLAIPVCLSVAVLAQGVQRDEFQNITNFKDAIFSKSVTAFSVDNPALRSQNDSISYDKIKGSPFWKDASQSALLYSSTGYIGALPVRINLATNKIYFIQNSEEMILSDNTVTKIVFQATNDSSVFISQVPNLLLNKKPVDGFVQVLNFGKYQFLKYTRRRLASADSPSHTSKNYYFTDDINYFIKCNDKVEAVKKLNKENLLIYLPSSSSYDTWAKENTINFKNEKDIVLFLNYYNARTSN